jgi:hypothetical protein
MNTNVPKWAFGADGQLLTRRHQSSRAPVVECEYCGRTTKVFYDPEIGGAYVVNGDVPVKLYVHPDGTMSAPCDNHQDECDGEHTIHVMRYLGFQLIMCSSECARLICKRVVTDPMQNRHAVLNVEQPSRGWVELSYAPYATPRGNGVVGTGVVAECPFCDGEIHPPCAHSSTPDDDDEEWRRLFPSDFLS